MDINQAQSIIDHAKQIDTFSLDEIIKKSFPDRKDYQNIVLGQMSLSEFIYLMKRVLNQFTTELAERENSLILPYIFTHNLYGQSQVDSQIASLFSYLNQSNFVSAETSLLWLVGYQIENGFYHKNSIKTNEILKGNISRLSEKLILIEKNLEEKRKEINSSFDELEIIKKDAQNLINQKREELNQLSTNLATSNSQTNQISELLNKGIDQSSRLNTILEQQEENKKNADKKLTEIQTIYSESNDKLVDAIKVLNTQIDEFNKQGIEQRNHLKFIEDKREFFEERINYLEELIGREVGASLFETFKQRKIELHKPVLFWRNAVPAMAVITIAWILFLFKNQVNIVDITLWWQVFAINTLKTIPAIFLLLFAIAQYRKERNFEEEYAFKSAVALTIDAYAERIEDLVSRDKLIMEAVLGVYKTPIEERLTNIKTKKSIETFKDIANTTSELLKNAKS